MLILHLTHPVCLPGAEARTWSRVHAWLAGPKILRPCQGTAGRATHQLSAGQSQEASLLPPVPVSHNVGQSEIVDFGFCFLLLTEQGQVPAYAHGESRASHSLIEEQQGGCLTLGAWGKMHAKTNSSAHGKRSRCCRTHLLLMGLKEGQEGNANSFGIALFLAREDNEVAPRFTTEALLHTST